MATRDVPPVAVSCGDPAGIGPEIACAAWMALRDDLPFVWIGDPTHLPEGTQHAVLSDLSDAATVSGRALPVLEHKFPSAAVPGTPSPENAPAVVDVIRRGVELAMSGEVSGLCTAPISKSVLVEWGGFRHPGHTEYLADLAGVSDVVMMLAAEELKVVPATIHIPLSEVPTALTAEGLEATIRITHAALIRDFGLERPRIALSGLNPHAGEDGLLGPEEGAMISPLVARLRAEGMELIGPLPGDTMFHAEARAGYDAAIAMYHDQALIPIKTLAFDRGVNVTLGLPFVRTSPDHGTAFGIAGQGIASPTSFIEALKLAERMARMRAARP